VLPARPLLSRRTHWRNRRRVRRSASGRSVYNYFRDYDAVTGRYVESDPIGLEGGLNTYLYAGANPLRNADPLGLKWVPCPNISRGAECWVPDPVVDKIPRCATAECAAGVLPNRPFRNPSKEDYADFLADLSADSGAAAMTCAVGGPEFWPGTAGFGAVSLTAHLVEQLLRPDPDKSLARLTSQLATAGLPPYVGGPVRMYLNSQLAEGLKRERLKNQGGKP
jgi:RHS repeat-associated protein